MSSKPVHHHSATFTRETPAFLAGFAEPIAIALAVRPDLSSSTTWTAASGNFNTAANWSNGLPALGVDAYIDGTNTAPLTISYSSGSDTANSLTTTYTTLDLSAGTLTLQYGSYLSSAAGAFSQTGGKIDFQNGESLNGTTTIIGNGSAVQQTAGTIQVDQGDLNVEGNSSFGGTVTGLSGGGTLVLDSQGSGATYTFTSTADVTIGELVLNGGNTTIDSGATINVSEIAINTNATLSAGTNITYAGTYYDVTTYGNNYLDLDGHTLSLTGSAEFESSAYTVFVEGPGTVALSGASTIGGTGGGGVVFGTTASLVNTGTVTQNFTVQIGDGSGDIASFTNSKGAIWNLTNNAPINTGSNASSSFTNAGLFENIGTNATPTIYANFTNTGTISAAASDTIYFDNSFTNTGTLTGGGQVAISGGVASFGSGTVLGVSELGLYNNAALTLGLNLGYAGSFNDVSNNGNSVLNLDGHTLSLSGSVELESSSYTVVVEGAGTLALTGASTIGGTGGGGFDLGSTAVLTNSGTVTQNYTVQIGDSSGNIAGITNSASGTWKLTTNAAIYTGSNASSSFTNAGLFEDIGTNTAPTIFASFTNTGTLSVASTDTVYFDNIFTNTGTITGTGQVAISGGGATFGSGTVLGVSQFGLYNTAALSLGTNLTYAGAFDDVSNNGNSVLSLDGHTLSLTGSVELESNSYTAAVEGPGTLALSGASTIGGNGGGGFALGTTAVLTNSGTVTQNLTVQIGDSTGDISSITNSSTGTWKLTTSASIQTGSNAASSFTNAGLFENIGTNTTPTISASFINTGTLSVATNDTVYFDNSLTNSGAITGGGQVAISGGVATLGSGTVLGVSQFSLLNSATLSLGANLTYAGAFDDVSNSDNFLYLDGHTLNLTGNVELESNSYTAAVEGAGTLTLSGASTIGGSSGSGVVLGTTAVLTNSGTVMQNNTVQIGDGSGDVAGIVNSATGTWKLTANNAITTGSNAASSFTNAGLLENVGNNAAPVISAVFNNTGTIDAVAASTSITLDDGGSLGGTLAGAGTIDLGGGTFTVASKAVLSVASLEISGGASVSFGTTTKLGTDFSQFGGTTINLVGASTELGLQGVSSLAGTVTGSGFVAVAAGATSSVDGLTLAGAAKFEDYGAVVNQGGQVTIGTTSSSTAILDLFSGSTYRITADVGIGGTGSINNQGFFEKYEGTNTSAVGVLVTNTGKLEAASGTLDFTANVTNNGTAVAVAGHTIEFGASLTSSTGGSGVIDLSDGGFAVFGGYVGSSQTLSFLDTSISEATLSAPGQFAATIKGFGGSNALFLSGLSNVSDGYSGTSSGGTLTLTEQINGDTVTVAQLHFAGNYGLSNFVITNNPGGVLIDYAAAAAAIKNEPAIGAASGLLPHGAGHF